MKVGFIGAGNMGGAIMRGAFQHGFLKPYETMVYDVSEQQLASVTAVYPIHVAESNVQLARECEFLILAVKPVFLRGVLDEIQKYVHNKKIISIAAGWSMAMLTEALGRENSAQVLRVMPNTPALVGAGYTAICEEHTFNKAALAWSKELFSTLGMVQVLPERLFDAVVAVSGSSPAYTYMYIEALVQAAQANGMSGEKAKIFAAQSVLGAAKMVLESPESLEQLRINVCSPKGTTIEAVETLFANGFMDKVKEGFQAAVDRSIEMTEEKKK